MGLGAKISGAGLIAYGLWVLVSPQTFFSVYAQDAMDVQHQTLAAQTQWAWLAFTWLLVGGGALMFPNERGVACLLACVWVAWPLTRLMRETPYNWLATDLQPCANLVFGAWCLYEAFGEKAKRL